MAGPQQRRQEEKRAERLEEIDRQVKDGSLVIRQMTPAERKQHPKPTGERSRARKRRY